ncbi:LamG-like jellyroll fold domain-containing protein [Kitasatospora sp. NPDC088783]|uniref:LamG-like jellyroll fold domain-containing protein n=1 Tax=Kitasatospora sp. NPDC088783 TaxID=3364077 RepID=UPI003810B5EF
MTAAAAKARTTGQPVAVDELTTETTQVVAQPKGGFAFTGNPKPVRTKQAGSWTQVDTALHRQADGTLAPAATAYGSVSFSGGGNGPMVSTSSGGTTYSLSWPGALPAPVVKGSTATYGEVLPGVDLVLSATVAGGFSEVLVVKDAKAAKNPAVAELELAAKTTGGTVTAGKAQDGVLVQGGHAALETGTPIMWDSNRAAPTADPAEEQVPRTAAAARAATTAPTASVGDPSDAAHPGSAARIAMVGTKATGDRLTLVPDAAMLGDSSTVYPAFIDPTFNWHPASANNPAFDEVKQGSPCNGASLYNNTSSAGNYGQLGAGYNGWSSCIGIERAFYQWSLPTVMWDADINSATVNATKVYSSSCGVTATVYLHWAGGIGSGTNWNNQPGYGSALSSAPFGPSYNHDYCPGNGSVTHGLDVTGPMRQSAAGHWGQFTAALTEDDYENSRDRNGFSRLSDNPSLQIFFNHHPYTPGVGDLSAVTGSDNAGCATGAPYPYIGKTIATNTPVLNARASDPDGDSVQVGYQYWVDGSSNVSTGWSGDSLASGSTGQFSLPSNFVSGLTNGQVVDWKASVYDGAAWSDWSPVCHFIAEPTAADSPFVMPNTTYPNTDKGGATGAAAGTTTTFEITGNPDSAYAPKMIYGLDQPPATSGTPANQIAAANGSWLSVPDGHWLLNDGSGTTGKDTGAYGNPVTLNGGNSWVNDPVRGKVLQLDGSTGYGTTSYPVIDTNQTLAVSTWVKLNSLSGNSTIVSQSDTAGTENGFQLYYSASWHAFSFNKMNADDMTGTAAEVFGPSSGPLAPVAGVWTHLAGVYDPATQKLTMYVNGHVAGSTTYTGANWDARGPVQIGRRLYKGAYGDYANAQISDVQLYSWTMDDWDINRIYDTARIDVTPLAPGPHTLWAASVDQAGDVSGMAAYRFTAAAHTPVSCASLTACFNNTAISADSNRAAGAADGTASFSATDLNNAGWTSGRKVTVNGATFTLPSFGSSQADNVLAANQTVTFNQAVPASGSTALTVLATSTNSNFKANGAVDGGNAAPYVPKDTPVTGVYCFNSTQPAAYCASTGTINYSDGSKQAYTLSVPDWTTGPSALAAITLPHRNKPTGQESVAASIYPFSIPLQPGKAISSISLPDVGNQAGQPGLHIFGLATRNTTVGTAEANGTTVAPATGQTWTGAWASPTEGNFNYQGGNFSNQTFRTVVRPSVSGNSLRVKLDDALGTSRLDIGHVTVAIESGATPSATPAAVPVGLTFGGSQSVSIPQGAMVYSDPLPFTVTANQELLVSFSLTNSVPYLVEHPWSNLAFTYLSAPGSGDHTADTAATAFSGTGTSKGWYTDVLTDLDVTTAGTPTQAVLGDGLTDAGQPGSSAANTYPRLAENLAGAVSSTSTPAGTVAEGIESNQIMKDNPQTRGGGPVGGVSALSRIDRDILDQPGLNSVVLQEGIEDLLGGTDANTLTSTGLAQLLSYLQTAGVNVTTVGLTPCDGYTGDGVAGANDPCTSTVDGYRTTVNTWLGGGNLSMNQFSTPYLYYADPDAALGVADTGNGEKKLAAGADAGDHVNLTQAGYGALTSAILTAQDTWVLNDNTPGQAGDTGTGITSTPWTYGQLPLTLSGGANYATDAARGTVLTLDGTSGTGATASQAVTTDGSFSVSTWVKLASPPTTNATIAAQSGSQASGFYLQYHQSDAKWCLMFMQSDTANANGVGTSPCASAAGAVGNWVHLVGAYDARAKTARLYVNGALAATGSGITNWPSTGAFTVGSAKHNATQVDYFPGSISGLQAWTYALTGPQAGALYQQLTPVH